MAKKIKISRNC